MEKMLKRIPGWTLERIADIYRRKTISALAANVAVLVSGDRHLLDLKQYQSVRILTAREFYEENIHKIT